MTELSKAQKRRLRAKRIKRIRMMRQFQRDHDELGDGAFFALAEDMYGWTQDTWIWFYENA